MSMLWMAGYSIDVWQSDVHIDISISMELFEIEIDFSFVSLWYNWVEFVQFCWHNRNDILHLKVIQEWLDCSIAYRANEVLYLHDEILQHRHPTNQCRNLISIWVPIDSDSCEKQIVDEYFLDKEYLRNIPYVCREIKRTKEWYCARSIIDTEMKESSFVDGSQLRTT